MRTLLYPCVAIPILAVSAALPAHSAAEAGPGLAVTAVNAFAADLYGVLGAEPGNLLYSPYSLSSALGMTYAGARGDTAAEMARTLSFAEGDELHASFQRLSSALSESAQGCTLTIANALWAQKGYPFLDAYTGLVTQRYEAGLETLDFEHQTEGARNTINAWVEERTNRLIKELFAPGSLDLTTRLVLTNAVYFKGVWVQQFDPALTREAPFRLAGGATVSASMMRRTGRYGYAETDEAQVLDMPYEGEGLSMVVILPRNEDGLSVVERRVVSEGLDAYLGAPLPQNEVRVEFPRFRMASGFSLAQTLARMGMPLAFSDRADLSGMTGSDELMLSAVEHKAYIDVNEEGTEAAAATGVVVVTKTAVAEPKVFRADHPFLFAIRDLAAGAVLFIGRVMDPTGE